MKKNQLNILYSNLEAVPLKTDLIPVKHEVIKTVKEITGGNSKNFYGDPISKRVNVENIEENYLAIYRS